MTGRLRRQPLKISLPNRNRNIIKAAQPQNPTVAYNGPTPRGGLDYSRPRLTALSAVILGQFMTVLVGVARESGGSAWFLVGEDTISGLRGADTRYLTAGARGTGWGSSPRRGRGAGSVRHLWRLSLPAPGR